MAKAKRPTEFKLGVFKWDIKYYDSPSDLHGETHKDLRKIDIYTHNISEVVIKDTLLHECLHVLLEDITDTVVRMESKSEEVEEQIVRLLTPRLHSIFTDNDCLRDYIFSVDNSKKK